MFPNVGKSWNQQSNYSIQSHPKIVEYALQLKQPRVQLFIVEQNNLFFNKFDWSKIL
jgi:hypothetical protein